MSDIKPYWTQGQIKKAYKATKKRSNGHCHKKSDTLSTSHKSLPKMARKSWWLSLSQEEQADYIYEKILNQGKQPNWQAIYADVISKHNHMV